MKRLLAGLAAVLGGAALAATPADAEAFLDAARRTYPTPAWTAGTNTLVTAYKVVGTDFADRPVPGGRIRWHQVDGMRNVRDLGGWNGLPTGRAFRGSEPDCQPIAKTGQKNYHNLNVTEKGLRTMRETLGIRTDLDLRGVGECPHPETSSLGVPLVRVPLKAYLGAFSGTNLYARALRVFADAKNYPIYFHCWGGADRTGTVAYLLEGLCGVNEVDLAIDYELTSFTGLFGVRRRDRTAEFPQFVAKLKTYPGATMAGRIAAYMETTLGLSREEIANIRRNLSGEKSGVQQGACLRVGDLSPASARLVVYPEYPAEITRDYAYEVRVAQGSTNVPLVVYNHCEKSVLNGRTRGGDVNRRFCEFAFDGAPVRVDIRVAEDVRVYKVFPARLGLKSAFRDGVLSVWLQKPEYFGVQLNDYDKTILSVFADAPENPAKVPTKGAPGVLFVEGWMDPPGPDGVLETDASVKEIYLAPGAVLNARLRLKGRGTWVHGRGMILDPLSDIFRYDQTKNTRRGLVTLPAGCTIEDVKLVDARTFNICAWGDGVTVRNVKELASMMCSDGLTNGGKNLLVEHCWLYVGDNALVVSGVKDAVYRDLALGTSCAAIFPQGSNSNVFMDRIDVFRADDGLINNFHNGVLRRNNKWSEMNGSYQKKEAGPQDLKHQSQDFLFRDLSAVDCTLFSHFFTGRNMGTLPKAFAFDGASFPASTGKSDFRSIGQVGGVAIRVQNDPAKYLITDNYALTFTNLWIGGAGRPFAAGEVAGADKIRFAYATTASPRPLPFAADRHEVNWTCPYKVFRGGALVRDWRLVRRDAGEQRLPAPPAGTNLVRERHPRQSVWQRVPSWSVKLETTHGTDEVRRTYELVQCERGAGLQAVVSDDVLAQGAGTYRLSFEVQVLVKDGTRSVPLVCRVVSNEWKREQKVQVGEDWTRVSLDFDLPVDPQVNDLVSVGIASTIPVDRIRIRTVAFARR